jgi:hypothetical protein
MKTMFRSVLVVLVLLVISGIATASAVAAPEYYINKVKLAGEESTSMTGGETHLIFHVSGVEINIGCKKNSATGYIEAGGNSKNEVLGLKECKAEKPAGCKLTPGEAAEIQSPGVSGKLEEEGAGKYFDKFTPTNLGQEWNVLELEKCTNNFWNGGHTYKGSIRASVDNGKEAVKHTFTFSTTSGSTLSILGGNPGELIASDTFELTGAKKGATVGINE